MTFPVGKFIQNEVYFYFDLKQTTISQEKKTHNRKKTRDRIEVRQEQLRQWIQTLTFSLGSPGAVELWQLGRLVSGDTHIYKSYSVLGIQ